MPRRNAQATVHQDEGRDEGEGEDLEDSIDHDIMDFDQRRSRSGSAKGGKTASTAVKQPPKKRGEKAATQVPMKTPPVSLSHHEQVWSLNQFFTTDGIFYSPKATIGGVLLTTFLCDVRGEVKGP